MRHRSTCLDVVLPEYVAGRLDPEARLHWDRHLVVCLPCQHAVADEQRLQALLAHAVPMPPERLRTQLLALASVDAAPGPADPVAGTLSPVPPVPAAPAPLVLVHPQAPAVHRSPLRSAVVAAAVVGASAAAAFTLTTNAPVRVAPVTTAVTGPARTVPSSGAPTFGATLVEHAGLGSPSLRSGSPSRAVEGLSGSPTSSGTASQAESLP